MKQCVSFFTGLWLCTSISTAFAQGTAFTYQGRLNDNGSQVIGVYDFRFRVASDFWGSNYVTDALLTNGVTVVNGLFAVTLDFGGGVFTGAARWLEMAVRTNGGGEYTTLSPLQALTPSPYAIMANSASNLLGALPSGSLAGSYENPLTLSNPANNFTGTFNGDGGALSNVNAAALGGFSAEDFWKLSGNNITPGQFLGSANNQAVDLRANGLRVLRLEPDPRPAGTAGNLIGGHTGNRIEQPGSGGSVIGGGGWVGGVNIIHSNSSGVFIGAGSGNVIGPDVNDSFIGAGYGNIIGGFLSSIASGESNVIQIFADHATIGGGGFNKIAGSAFFPVYSTIGGGQRNSIETNGTYGVIGGGIFNTIQTNASRATIGGGYSNVIHIGASSSTIGGGFRNHVHSGNATIGGGEQNTVTANNATVAGGGINTASGPYATVGGGSFNNASGLAATIPGGSGNGAAGENSFAAGWVAHADHDGSFVWSDVSSGFHFNSTSSNQFSVRAMGGARFVTGGAGATVDGQPLLTSQALTNVWLTGGNVDANPTNGNFLGTRDNQPLEFKVAGRRALRLEPATNADPNYNFAPNVIGGHESNRVAPGIVGATIAGGGRIDGGGQDLTHRVTAHHGTIGGGDRNTVEGEDGTVAGGGGNYAAGAYSTIAGGLFNSIQTGGYSASVGGGFFNSGGGNYATVGGGYANASLGLSSTVPGGYQNTANGSYSFAAGYNAHANHAGAFVWSDSAGAIFSSSNLNEFAVKAGGGVRFVTAGAGMTVDGERVSTVELTTDTPLRSNMVNVVNGSPVNFVAAGVRGATISGGGAGNYDGTAYTNSIAADLGTIGGGAGNTLQVFSDGSTVGGGSRNKILGAYNATIAGGVDNTINAGALNGSIGGGQFNTIQAGAFAAKVGGGYFNNSSGNYATVGGGFNNSSSGTAATVPGGQQNVAAGNYSFAAGRSAQANHQGAFVWADSMNASFSSTSSNQFLVRASGGVGINTNDPGGAALNVAGTVKATGFQGDGSGLVNVSAGALGNYVFAYSTGSQTVGAANSFQDVTFNNDAQINGWTHDAGTAPYTAAQSGLYLIQYTAETAITAAPGSHVSIRGTLNRSEVPGSQSSVSPTVVGQALPVSKSFIASVTAADVFTLEFTGTTTSSRLLGGNGAGGTRPSVSLTITRIQ